MTVPVKKKRTGRPVKNKNKMPKRNGLPAGMWHQELVGLIKGYPDTQEKWQARHDAAKARYLAGTGLKPGRRGVPDGWAGKKEELAQIRAQYFNEGKMIVKQMIKEGFVTGFDEDDVDGLNADDEVSKLRKVSEEVDATVLPETEAERAALMLTTAAQMARCPAVSIRDRQSAMRMFLDFTRSKPAQKSEVAVMKPEDFLNDLAHRAGLGDA